MYFNKPISLSFISYWYSNQSIYWNTFSWGIQRDCLGNFYSNVNKNKCKAQYWVSIEKYFCDFPRLNDFNERKTIRNVYLEKTSYSLETQTNGAKIYPLLPKQYFVSDPGSFL